MSPNAPATPSPATARRLTCGRCGIVFNCQVGADCWCAAEAYRLPMPADAAQDCLCPACLRAAAAVQNAVQD